jgi:hypothetical protein
VPLNVIACTSVALLDVTFIGLGAALKLCGTAAAVTVMLAVVLTPLRVRVTDLAPDTAGAPAVLASVNVIVVLFVPLSAAVTPAGRAGLIAPSVIAAPAVPPAVMVLVIVPPVGSVTLFGLKVAVKVCGIASRVVFTFTV